MTGEIGAEESVKLAKVVGIGLNKTGTKTLGRLLECWGYRNRTYDSNNTTESPSFTLYQAGRVDDLLELMEEYDSFEDWPWPLLYREIDHCYPDARFILTTRKDAATWYRSMCNMTVRIGPLPLYEKHVYGATMPQGHRREYIQYYEAHNAAVLSYFRDRPEKLLHICWEHGQTVDEVAAFLGTDPAVASLDHVNRSPRFIYNGDNLLLAHAQRIAIRLFRSPSRWVYRQSRALKQGAPGIRSTRR